MEVLLKFLGAANREERAQPARSSASSRVPAPNSSRNRCSVPSSWRYSRRRRDKAGRSSSEAGVEG
ncbi:hypothetical protein ACN28S_05310 [Cystobacter fuscus]